MASPVESDISGVSTLRPEQHVYYKKMAFSSNNVHGDIAFHIAVGLS